jgi:serine protease
MSLKQFTSIFRRSLGNGRFVAAAALVALAALTLFAGSGPASAAQTGRKPRASGQAVAMPTDQLIVHFRAASDPAALSALDLDALVDRMSAAAGVTLTLVRPMSGGDYVFKLPGRVSLDEATAIADDLAALADVEYAVPDGVNWIGGGPMPVRTEVPRQRAVPRAADLSPDDTEFAAQWHYRYAPGDQFEPTTEEGINLPPAWSITTGSASTVVAVLDTGIRPHADLAGRTAPGYDFIADTFTANDGGGRDNDPSDPGDWTNPDACFSGWPGFSSSWHGTHVAGTVGAASNNGSNVAGVNWQAKILPVRVLGRCGGYDSDIIDAIRWAAGLPVGGAPANPNPANVINLSLGGPSPCSGPMQSAMNDAVNAGTVVVVAAGNSGDNAAGYSPANCNGVITVAATDKFGERAWYSNYGSVVEVSAPGGDTFYEEEGVLSTLNAGATGPGADSLAFYQGTSMAAPHVAGVASLLMGQDPSLTPAEVLDVLESTARSFPGYVSFCTTANCGAGIIDAYAALSSLDALPDAPALAAPADGTTVTTATPEFEWSPISGADGYVLQIATDAAFTQNLMEEDIASASFTPAADLADDTYYWRVKTVIGADESLWSEVWSVTVDAVEDVEYLIYLPMIIGDDGGFAE